MTLIVLAKLSKLSQDLSVLANFASPTYSKFQTIYATRSTDNMSIFVAYLKIHNGDSQLSVSVGYCVCKQVFLPPLQCLIN